MIKRCDTKCKNIIKKHKDIWKTNKSSNFEKVDEDQKKNSDGNKKRIIKKNNDY